ncbi:uncharacterized protein LOC110036134 [Phalaenopsis equestris]|uniref:uncharacterized protein LOC110036134 n=1 Tax=Phalaenopsis equestris TaxID=78828 RepID=UPI0009E62930|nr:uncharacterized protein LOC110036134 [Phalaenopsis equestris]
MFFFQLEALANALLTDDILKLKGLRRPSCCYLCNDFEESLDHLFFQCPFSQQVWFGLLDQLKDLKLDGTLSICWLDWYEAKLSIILCIVAWFLWISRNQAKFDEIQLVVKGTKTNCTSYIQKLIKHYRFNNICLNYAPNVNENMLPPPLLIYWTPPMPNLLKVNTDGSYSIGDAGIEGVFRNSNGKCLLHFYSPTVALDPLEAEMPNICWAIYIANISKISNLVVEFDSLTCFNILQ